MRPVLAELLGKYYLQFFIAALEAVRFALYMLVLCHGKRRRDRFCRRFALLWAVQLLLCLPISILRTGQDGLTARVLLELVLSAEQLAAVFLLYQEDLSETLLMFSAVLVTKNMSGNTVQLLLNLAGQNDKETISFFPESEPIRDWTIYAILHLVLLLLTAYLFRRGERNRHVHLDLSAACLFTGATLVLRCLIQPAVRLLQPDDLSPILCIRALLVLIYALLAAIRAGLLSRKTAETELDLTRGLLRQERKRYAEMRDTIEVINMRCHDLKHQLSRVQGKLTEEETRALRDAIELYDGNIRTGSEIVDTVLYGKKLVCEKNGIRLSCLCDGAAVRFMEPSQLYSLLDNALENAVEASAGLAADDRMILVTIGSSGDSAVIEVSNYFDPAALAAEEETSKPDKVHHGYGLKSMRYIAGMYGGTVETRTEENMFFLTVTIPKPEQ